MQRRTFLAAPAFLPSFVSAQGNAPLICVLRTGSPNNDLFADVFRRDMARLGHDEGRSYRTQYAYANGNMQQLPSLATDLIQAGAQLIVAFSVSGVAAVQAATNTIPIVAMADDLALVTSGQVSSIARPGGNTTGVSMLGRLLDLKRLEILHELVPKATKVGVITDGTPSARAALGNFEDGARKLGLTINVAHIQNKDQVALGLASLAAAQVEAVQFFASTFLHSERQSFMSEMVRMKLPAIYEWPETVEEGGLSSYGPRITLCYRHVAVLVSKILKGTKPADLPIEHPATFTLAINTGAAKKIGIVLPESMLLRADLLVD